jgi:hypothetical protein
MKHAWLIKNKPNDYYNKKNKSLALCYPNGRSEFVSEYESDYEFDMRIASYWIGINGEIYPQISAVSDTKDITHETKFIYLGEVVKK